MVSIVDAQREILLDPIGTNVWRFVESHRQRNENSPASQWPVHAELEQRGGHLVSREGAVRPAWALYLDSPESTLRHGPHVPPVAHCQGTSSADISVEDTAYR